MGCNYLSLPLIPAAGTRVLMVCMPYAVLNAVVEKAYRYCELRHDNRRGIKSLTVPIKAVIVIHMTIWAVWFQWDMLSADHCWNYSVVLAALSSHFDWFEDRVPVYGYPIFESVAETCGVSLQLIWSTRGPSNELQRLDNMDLSQSGSSDNGHQGDMPDYRWQ